MDISNPGRRGFLSLCTTFLMAGLALLLAIPAIAYFLTPLWGRREEEAVEGGFVPVGRIAELPIDEWRLLLLELDRQDGWKKSHIRHAIWVRRAGKGEADLTVLSSICPHLGCPIDWHPQPDPKKAEFVCPCHKGTFSAEGEKTGGPPPRNMDPLEFKVRGGQLLVRWVEYKIGVANRISVNA